MARRQETIDGVSVPADFAGLSCHFRAVCAGYVKLIRKPDQEYGFSVVSCEISAYAPAEI